MKKYLVFSKGDDYGACQTEVVETTEKNAKAYYHFKEIEEQDALTLIKYFGLVDSEEEKERSDDRRFYGSD